MGMLIGRSPHTKAGFFLTPPISATMDMVLGTVTMTGGLNPKMTTDSVSIMAFRQAMRLVAEGRLHWSFLHVKPLTKSRSPRPGGTTSIGQWTLAPLPRRARNSEDLRARQDAWSMANKQLSSGYWDSTMNTATGNRVLALNCTRFTDWRSRSPTTQAGLRKMYGPSWRETGATKGPVQTVSM